MGESGDWNTNSALWAMTVMFVALCVLIGWMFWVVGN